MIHGGSGTAIPVSYTHLLAVATGSHHVNVAVAIQDGWHACGKNSVTETKSEFPEEQITALLTGLQMRGVTVDELLGFRCV